MRPLDLGVSLDPRTDGTRVGLDPGRGPLLILGDPGAGGSFALKRLFRNWCLSEDGGGDRNVAPPLMLDPLGSGQCSRLAAALGVGHVYLRHDASGEDAGSGPPADADEPVAVSGGIWRPCSGACELPGGPCGQIKGLVHGARPRHLFVDDLYHVLRHQVAGALPLWAYSYGADLGIFCAGVLEPRVASRLRKISEVKRVLSSARQLLLLRVYRPHDDLPPSVLRSLRASTRSEEVLAKLPTLSRGEGFLVDAPPRGVRPKPVVWVNIDAADEEIFLFNTDPELEPILRADRDGEER